VCVSSLSGSNTCEIISSETAREAPLAEFLKTFQLRKLLCVSSIDVDHM
jgi:hypothetical protein